MSSSKTHTVGETYFFRDQGQFDLLRFNLLPELIERRQNIKSLRLWSAGCASGEEAYSLAISVDMLLPERNDWTILIVGSDINPNALAKARQARYGQWSFRQVPAIMRQRYFYQERDEWQLDERIRGMVRFRQLDLINESFGEFQDIDLILCRNVFIYFNAATVAAVANKLTACLSESGYLMTGHSELSGVAMPNMQSRVFTASVAYQRCPAIAVAATPVTVETPHRFHSSPKLTMLPTQPAPTITQTLTKPDINRLLTTARSHADRGEYTQAEEICHQALTIAPLLAMPHFLMAQVAQLQGNFQRATDMLEKTLYLEPDNTAALLELASLYERSRNPARAKTLRRMALDLIRQLPSETMIDPFEMTAAEIAQWLMQRIST